MTDDQLAENIDKYFKFLKTDKTDPVTLYLEGLAPSGRRSMRSLLQISAEIFKFEGELERMPWPLLQYHHIAQVRSTLQNNGKSSNTINLTLSACRGVMKACFNLGLIKADQLMLINEVKRVRGKKLPSGRCLTQYETKSLITACKRDKSIAGKRDLAVIVLMLATGLRRSEVVALDIDDKPLWYDANKTDLLESHQPGDVIIKSFNPLQFLAIVHDLDQTPSWRTE